MKNGYKYFQYLQGSAHGLWHGIAFWFILIHLKLPAVDVAFIIGIQMLTQVILDVFTGMFSEKNKKTSIIISLLLYIAFSIAYIAADYVHQNTEGSSLKVLLFLSLGQICFGIGFALQSGSVEELFIENFKQKHAKIKDQKNLEEKIKEITFIKESHTTIIGALSGLLGFLLVLNLDQTPEFIKDNIQELLTIESMPWVISNLIYIALIFFTSRLKETEIIGSYKKNNIRFYQIAKIKNHILAEIDKYSQKSISYITEQPTIKTVFGLSCLFYSLFVAHAAFWVIFCSKSLNINLSSLSSIGTLQVSLMAGIVCFGRLTHAYGARYAKKRSLQANKGMFFLLLLFFSLGLIIEVVAICFSINTAICVFSFGFILCQFIEGISRSLLNTLSHRSMLSEISTLRSIESMLRSLSSLIVVGIIGFSINQDPLIGYLLLTVFSIFAVFLLILVIDGEILITTNKNILISGRVIFFKNIALLFLFFSFFSICFFAISYGDKIKTTLFNNSITAKIIGSQNITPVYNFSSKSANDSAPKCEEFCNKWKIVSNKTVYLSFKFHLESLPYINVAGEVNPETQIIYDSNNHTNHIIFKATEYKKYIIMSPFAEPPSLVLLNTADHYDISNKFAINYESNDYSLATNYMLFIQIIAGSAILVFCLLRAKSKSSLTYQEINRFLSTELHDIYSDNKRALELQNENYAEIMKHIDCHGVFTGQFTASFDRGTGKLSIFDTNEFISNYHPNQHSEETAHNYQLIMDDIIEIFKHISLSKIHNSSSLQIFGSHHSYKFKVNSCVSQNVDCFVGTCLILAPDVAPKSNDSNFLATFSLSLYFDNSVRYINKTEQSALSTLSQIVLHKQYKRK